MSQQDRSRRALTAAGMGLTQRIVQALCTLAQMPLLLRMLGANGMGVWGAATSLCWLSGLLDIGVGMALVTLVARALAQDDAPCARRQLSAALCIGAGMCMLVAVASTIGFLFSNRGLEVQSYLIAGIGLSINIPLSTASNVWMALQKGRVSSSWETAQTLLVSGGIFFSAAMGSHDPRLYTAVVLAGYLAGNLGSLLHLMSSKEGLRPAWCGRDELREVAGSGLQFMIWSLSGGLTYMLDGVLTLHWIGPEAAALMAIGSRICLSVAGLQVTLTLPLWPAFADAMHRREWTWVHDAARRSFLWLTGATALLGCALTLFGGPLLTWWLRRDLGFSHLFLAAVALWLLAHALLRIPNLLLNAMMELRLQIALYAMTSVLALLLKYLLAPTLGVAGILLGTSTLSLAICIPCFALVLQRMRLRRRLAEEPADD